MNRLQIVKSSVYPTTYENATSIIIRWAAERQRRVVIAANVHVIMEAYDSNRFRQIVAEADLVLPDGMPLVWALKAMGASDASRVYGPTLTTHVCAAAAINRIPVALYGGTPESLLDFQTALTDRFPELSIACKIAPPFRALTPEEDDAYTEELVRSGARIIFVGIGCPKQERWMAAHKGRIPAVMLGVGAAFDFHSGRVRQAPSWMQRAGLEWLFRLAQEPRRLWKRYLKHNPRFAALVIGQILRSRFKLDRVTS